jgi:hypothetical protein
MKSNQNGRWRSVTQREPCPACGHGDWCAWTPDGKGLRCMRCGNPPRGMKLAKSDSDGGMLFVAVDLQVTGSARKSQAKKAGATRPSLDELAERFRAALGSERTGQLAADLGVTPASLDALAMGWATIDDLRVMQASGAGWADNRPDGAEKDPAHPGR